MNRILDKIYYNFDSDINSPVIFYPDKYLFLDGQKCLIFLDLVGFIQSKTLLKIEVRRSPLSETLLNTDLNSIWDTVGCAVRLSERNRYRDSRHYRKNRF